MKDAPELRCFHPPPVESRFVPPVPPIRSPGPADGASGHPVSRSPGSYVTGSSPHPRAGSVTRARSAGGLAGRVVVRGSATGPTAASRLLTRGFFAPGGLIKRGHVQFWPAADETIRVVEVLIGRQ